MTTSSANHDWIGRFRSKVASYEVLNPDFVAELDMLNITVDEYERMLAASEPRIITTDNTVS